jgi:5-methylcytosine-specific restriction endonuclease McrA
MRILSRNSSRHEDTYLRGTGGHTVMNKALLLNADYSPLHFISNLRAFIMVHKGKAEIIDIAGKPSTWSSYIKTSTAEVESPATVRLLSRVTRKWFSPRFRKSAIYSRDNWSCQYCGEGLCKSNATIDHVMPRAKGGQTSWKNCVASCKNCNRIKGCKTPLEANMPLLTQPIEPKRFHLWDSTRSSVWHEDWSYFIKDKSGA